ncbi:hypothetical protein CEXT_18751 [Caerostris extrusa]|uniref:Uncharacterized protein n=1 Tax=Caerostris extrusa TaxID=172846 RepID=A0AAV4SI15_CAEEX|nr:hypothetical protein CEXT_18751 [Caerostris extrusa]
MVTSKFRSVKCTNFRVWNFHGITRTRKRHANWVPTRKGFVLVHYGIRRVGTSIEYFITWKVISKLHRLNFSEFTWRRTLGMFLQIVLLRS